MKYEITGANRETGAEITVTVEAGDFHHAEQQANDLGIVVSSVREVHSTTAAPEIVGAAPPTPAAPRQSGSTCCSACGGSPLVRRKVYRIK